MVKGMSIEGRDSPDERSDAELGAEIRRLQEIVAARRAARAQLEAEAVERERERVAGKKARKAERQLIRDRKAARKKAKLEDFSRK
jgi:hypothetical protein